MILKRTLSGAMAMVAAATAAVPANAGHRDDAWVAGAIGFGVGALFGGALAQPRYYEPRPYYYQPAPQYYRPAPPPPVYYQPAPVYRPAPVYVQPATGSGYRPEPWTQEWYAYCDNRYRSFNPQTGYFMGYDGQYHFCR